MVRNVNTRQSFANFVIPERPPEQPKSKPKKSEEPPLLKDKLPLAEPIVVAEPQRAGKKVTPPQHRAARKKPKTTRYLLLTALIAAISVSFYYYTPADFSLTDLVPSSFIEGLSGDSSTMADPAAEPPVNISTNDPATTDEPKGPTFDRQIQASPQPLESQSNSQPHEPATRVQSEQQSEAAPIFQPVTQPEPVNPVPNPYVQARIAQARSYLANGYITAPRDGNAVMQLRLALYQDPTNAEALELMDTASQRLISAAREAKQAGLDFDARNLLEELLSFHPEHVEASRLQREWLN